MKKIVFVFVILLSAIGYSQNSTKEVLFTIDGKPYYTDEFSRVYKKNLDLVKDESQKELNQYLELFVGYKLKISKAYKLSLDKGEQYINELKSNRAQLAKNYTSDSKVTKELVNEAYNRSLKEIKASHILLMVDENASPQDTLKVFNEIQEIRNRVIKGEDFSKLASLFSQDPSAKENKGALGYFSAFRMVYPFESAAYKTAVGGVSKPVRTRFGYHLIKVEDIRDNRGELVVAHIMILNPENAKPNSPETEKAKNTIFEIYKKIQQGEAFEDLAKQFSEDKSSASKGGMLNRFGSGQLSSEEFESAAFSIEKEGQISAPFQSQFGWHIVKLINKFPVKTFDEMQPELESKVSKDERSRLISDSVTEKLRKKYAVKRDDALFTSITKLVTDDFYEAKWEVPANQKILSKKLVSINGKSFTADSFLQFVKAQQKSNATIKPIGKMVANLYQRFVDEQLNVYYDENLENEFPEFSLIMDEYRDGLLLFDLMEKEIWNKSKTDTLGLKKFYEDNIKNYQWKNRMNVVILSSTNSEILKKARKLMLQGKSADFIKEKLNEKDGKINVMSNEGTFEEGSDILPKNVEFKVGVTEIFSDGKYFFVTQVNSIKNATSKTLEECKGKAINDYQQYLEENWVKNLKAEFKVEVDQAVFEKVKKELKS